MDVADTCCQEVDSEICNSLALIRISALAFTDDAVFLAADRTNLCLQRHSVLMSDLDKLCRLSYVLVDRVV